MYYSVSDTTLFRLLDVARQIFNNLWLLKTPAALKINKIRWWLCNIVTWMNSRSTKFLRTTRLPTNNPISIALKMAASTLRESKTYLGAQFRRLRTRLGAPIAIKAMAAKLARLVYRMLRYGIKYIDQGAPFYEAQHRHLQINQLKSKAASLGYRVTPIPAAA